jgi:hypothetical protein
MCTSAEFCTQYRNDLDRRALAQKKKSLEQLGLAESRLHCTWRKT